MLCQEADGKASNARKWAFGKFAIKITAWVSLLIPLSMGISTTWAAPPTRRAAPVAPIFTVNSAADQAAAPPLDDGICQTAPGNGICTLRAAIMKANHWPGGSVTIILPALPAGDSYKLTIPTSVADDEATGDLDVTHQTGVVVVIGAGASQTIIDGNGGVNNDRVFLVGLGAALVLSGATVQGGTPLGSYGGGIYNGGNLVLYNSTIARNQAIAGGGGIYNRGTLTVYTSTISSNDASFGGGVANDPLGTMTLVATTVRNNTGHNGGGIWSGGTGGLTLINSTITGNLANLDGGGLYNFKTATLINSTISGNRANRDGGGIWNGPSSGDASVLNVTVADNQADADLNGTGTSGGVFNDAGTVIQLKNSLLANNLASDYDPERQVYFFYRNECGGSVTSFDYNLVSSTSGCTFAAGPNDHTNLDPVVGPLQDNGGPTWTNALLPGSPAIDAGQLGDCTDSIGVPLTTDQRGFPRPAFGGHSFRCDIGAYELQQLAYLPLVRK